MTPEERFERIERNIEFIVSQQAQFYADLRKLEEQAAQNSELIRRNSRQIGQHSQQIQQLTDLLMRTGRIIEEATQQSEQRFDPLDKRLNVLIDVVERYFSDGHRSS